MVKVLPFAYPSIYKVAMSTFNDVLEASIGEQHVVKEGDIASSPCPLKRNKISVNRHLFAMGNCPPSHPLCVPCIAMSASNDVLEASIGAFTVAKDDGVASSPSLLVKSRRSANKYCLLWVKCSPSHVPYLL